MIDSAIEGKIVEQYIIFNLRGTYNSKICPVPVVALKNQRCMPWFSYFQNGISCHWQMEKYKFTGVAISES